MNKMTKSTSNVKLIITFFLLWMTSFLSPRLEEYLAYFMILTVGILHGANDIELLSSNIKLKKSKPHVILLTYIAMVSLTAISFITIPEIMLMVFIALSAYHFGEQHFNKKIRSESRLKDAFFITYGLTLFFMLFALNSEDTAMIMGQIGVNGMTELIFYFGFYLSMGATLFIGSILRLERMLEVNIFREVFLLLLFYLIFSLASLLWAFAIYFVIWHAYPSIQDQIQYLRNHVKRFDLMQYVKSSLIYWVISVTGIVLLFFLTSRSPELFHALFFTLIAAISFPHIFVIRNMNK